MGHRRWIGLAILLLTIGLAIGLQACFGCLYDIRGTVLDEPPHKRVTGSDDFVMTEWQCTIYEIVPNWPVAVPLATLASAGLVLLALPRKGAS